MSLGIQSEAELENQLIRRLQAIGYGKVVIPDENALMTHFKAVLEKRNAANLKGKPLSDREFKAVMNELIGSRTYYQVAEIIRGSETQPSGKVQIQRDDNSQLFLNLFDGVDYKNNIYEVTHQTTFEGKHEDRYDVLILINGMPIAQVELKRRDKEFTEAFQQIIRYRNETQKFARLLKTIQLYVVTSGGETRYFANGDGSLNPNFMFYWTDEHNHWLNDLDAFTASFFAPKRFHSIIARYTIFDRVNKKMMIMRPYQIFATEAIIAQAHNHPEQNGYVWHTTGSGKTITSFKASRLLAQTTSAEKVIFLIDRRDLDQQTAKNFTSYLPATINGETALDRTDNTDALVKQLDSNDHQLIVTTIQKLSNAVAHDRFKKVLTPYHDKRVAFIEDEAHRSQFGLMRKNVNHWFQNAQHFGFTGTPIFKENVGADGRTTADLYDHELHRYLIKDAIRDHNVLPFTVQYINTIKGKELQQDEQVPGINTQEVFEADARLELIAQHILLNHDQFTHNRRYNAIFTVPNTRIALKYYNIFKKLRGKDSPNVTAIFTWKANEDDNDKHQDKDDVTSRMGLDKVIDDYNHRYHQNFSTEDFSGYFKDVSKRMVEHSEATPEDNIDILIVVNMFLTGFDSKRLSTLYVDKKLQWHTLIQAFSRTNRVETDAKPSGNIIAYRNLKKETDDAVTLFSDGAKDQFFAPTYAKLKDDFLDAIAALKKVAPTPAAVDDLYSAGESKVRDFVLAYRDIMRIFNRLQVYDDFVWKQFETVLTAREKQEYEGKYKEAYRRLVKPIDPKKVSILQDIDFELSLVQKDEINVDYIVNLINSISTDNPQDKEADTRKVKRLLSQSTDPELKSKAELLEQFLEKVVPQLEPKADVSAALTKFLKESEDAAIRGFAMKNNLSPEFVSDQVQDYGFYGKTDTAKVNDELSESGLSFMGIVKVGQAVKQFVQDTVSHFTSN